MHVTCCCQAHWSIATQQLVRQADSYGMMHLPGRRPGDGAAEHAAG